MSNRDYYDILEIGREAGVSDIKRAYRKKAMQYHPDRNKGSATAEKKFKEAAEAYEVLSNDEKRRQYDQFGHDAFRQSTGGGFSSQHFSFEDIFSRFGDVFSNEGFFSTSGESPHQGRKTGHSGSNLKITMTLTLEEIAFGLKKTVKVKKKVKCSGCKGSGAFSESHIRMCHSCNGTGELRRVTHTMLGQMVSSQTCHTCQGGGRIISKPCALCSGHGRINDRETINIEIPSGVKEGNYLTLSGRGNAGIHGGPAGDLIVIIKEKEHPFFSREGNNIYYNLTITIPQAIFGAKVEIPTLKGMCLLKIEPGTQPYKVLKMTGRGIRGLHGRGVGDQLIRINIYVPESLSDAEKKKLAHLNDHACFNIPRNKEGKKGFFSKIKNSFSSAF